MKYKRNNNHKPGNKTTTALVERKNNHSNSNPKPSTNSNIKKKKHAGGRPPKYNADLFPNQAYVACSRMGSTMVDLAKLFNVTEVTVHQWMHDYDEFSKYVKKGTDEWTNKVAKNSLRMLIEGFEYEEVTVKQLTISQGRGADKITLPATETTTMKKRCLPNMGAIAFWLKNKSFKEDGDREFKDYKAVEIGNMDDDKPLKIRVTLEAQDEK